MSASTETNGFGKRFPSDAAFAKKRALCHNVCKERSAFRAGKDDDMEIRWLGHSCMMLREGGYTLVCDPYGVGSVPGTELPDDLEADRVLCSHEHHDHNARGRIRLKDSGAYPFKVTAVPSWHDPEEGRLRGPNIIHVIDTDYGIRAVHMGDIGEPLTDEQAAAIGTPDVLMLPVGGFFTVGPEEAKRIVERLSPRVTIPMHYRGKGFGYDVIGTLDEFTSLFDPALLRRYGATVEIGSDTPKQIALLELPSKKR